MAWDGKNDTDAPLVLALETSCDETAAAVLRAPGTVLASEISSQIELHRPFGGVVPEVASRNHILMVRPVVEKALSEAGVPLDAIDLFAATSGPGLASSLLIGNTAAKAFSVATGRPFLAVNHMEGHLLSPFLGNASVPRACVALVVSGGHTMLIHMRGTADYTLLGHTRDDAAGEAFDKVAKMLGLPYPGGPEIEKSARGGDPSAFAFPRSMLDRKEHAFSFSGLKTAMLYTLDKLPGREPGPRLADLCASFQEAVVDVLVEKSIRAARATGERLITVSGGVSCNGRLRSAFAARCESEGLDLLFAQPSHSTDNAAMIAYAAALRFARGDTSCLDKDVDPNLSLAEPCPGNR